jgi:Family of unknown function (DUF5678)
MSTMTAENVLRLIEQLPSTERIRLKELLARRRTLQEAEPAKAKPPLDKRVPCEPMKDRTRELKWIEEHKHEYAGQWVALDGDRLIAASPIQQEVWDAIEGDNAKLPLVHRIPSPDDLPYIGI